MNRNALRFSMMCAGLIATILAGLSGCGTSITPDTTVSEALSQLAQAAGTDAALSQVTLGDLVQTLEASAGAVVSEPAGAAPTPLTEEQQAQLDELQGQLDRGEITQEEFNQQANDLLGDMGSADAFAGGGMMGGPPPGDPMMRLAEELQLTDEQRQQADDIFARLHTDIEALHETEREQTEAVLTAEQLATLNELASQEPMPPPPHERGAEPMGPPPGEADPNMAFPGGPGGHMGPPPGAFGPGGDMPPPPDTDGAGADLGPLGRFADELQLTDEQTAAIAQIHADGRTAVEARHQQARDEFRAILTADQQATLDELEAQPGPM